MTGKALRTRPRAACSCDGDARDAAQGSPAQTRSLRAAAGRSVSLPRSAVAMGTPSGEADAARAPWASSMRASLTAEHLRRRNFQHRCTQLRSNRCVEG